MELNEKNIKAVIEAGEIKHIAPKHSKAWYVLYRLLGSYFGKKQAKKLSREEHVANGKKGANKRWGFPQK